MLVRLEKPSLNREREFFGCASKPCVPAEMDCRSHKFASLPRLRSKVEHADAPRTLRSAAHIRRTGRSSQPQ
jgi:hypothetical protein